MEDIEQWLSTDVVSQGHPAQKERLRPTPHMPDGAPVPLMRKWLVVGQGDKLVVTRGALLWDTLVAGSVPSASRPPRPGHFPLEKGLCTAPSTAAGAFSSPSCQCEVPLGAGLSRALLHTTELPAPQAPRTNYLGTSRPRGCPLQATVKTMFLPTVPRGSMCFCLVAEAYPLPSPQLERARPQSVGVSLSTVEVSPSTPLDTGRKRSSVH